MSDLNKNHDYKEWVERLVFRPQTSLIDELLKQGFLSWNHVKNSYDEEYREYREVFEWWIVDSWLLDKLESLGSPVLRTDYGSWWGRVTTGQSVIHDEVLQEIYVTHNPFSQET